MGLFLTQGRLTIAFADWMQYWGHLGDESLMNGFMWFVKHALLWEALFRSFPEKNHKDHHLLWAPHLSCSAKDIQVYEIFLEFSDKCCTPSPVYRHLAVTFSLSILCVLSLPPFIRVTPLFSRGSLVVSEMHFKSSLHFCSLCLIF